MILAMFKLSWKIPIDKDWFIANVIGDNMKGLIRFQNIVDILS